MWRNYIAPRFGRRPVASVFYINLPLGVLALVVVATGLHAPGARLRHQIDYLGALVISAAVTCVVLLTSLGGTTYDWGSGIILGLIAAAVVLVGLAVPIERRTAEPILAAPAVR